MSKIIPPLLNPELIGRLVAAATEARTTAYAPYSRFPVGAALLTADARIIVGCNVENASYGLSSCAERNATFRAVAEGARRFEAIAVVTEGGVAPCGACRQVLAEFNPEMAVILADTAGLWTILPLDDLLPRAFGPEDLPAAG